MDLQVLERLVTLIQDQTVLFLAEHGLTLSVTSHVVLQALTCRHSEQGGLWKPKIKIKNWYTNRKVKRGRFACYVFSHIFFKIYYLHFSLILPPHKIAVHSLWFEHVNLWRGIMPLWVPRQHLNTKKKKKKQISVQDELFSNPRKLKRRWYRILWFQCQL